MYHSLKYVDIFFFMDITIVNQKFNPKTQRVKQKTTKEMRKGTALEASYNPLIPSRFRDMSNEELFVCSIIIIYRAKSAWRTFFFLQVKIPDVERESWSYTFVPLK